MSAPKKKPLAPQARESRPVAFLARLCGREPLDRLDAKIARARTQDEPVLYAHALPGLDLLLCAVPGAQPPYPQLDALRTQCLEAIAHALEQPLAGLQGGGYWYEANGLGCLIFASDARTRVLAEFGAARHAR